MQTIAPAPRLLAAALLCAWLLSGVDASKATVKVSPILYGLMTKELNFSFDGGLYPPWFDTGQERPRPFYR